MVRSLELIIVSCFLMIRRPPRSTRTDTLALHDALPIYCPPLLRMRQSWTSVPAQVVPDTSRYLTPASRNGETPCRTCPWPHSAAGHPYMETIMPFLTRKPRIGALLAVTMGGPLIMSVMSATPAHAQITVFDPSNYAQNLTT